MKKHSERTPLHYKKEESKGHQNPFWSSLRFKIYVLIFFNLLLFANTLFNRFTFDDREYIIQNPYVQNPGRLFSLFTHAYPPHKPDLSLYRPLVEATYLLDWCRSLRPSKFTDLNFNDRVEMPFFHLTNIIFHIAAVLIIFFLVRRLWKNETMAIVTALIFSAHPVHVETVTSLVGRAESMSAFFFLLSLYLFIKEEEKERLLTPPLILSYLMFFFALLSKESAITLPPVILMTTWFLRRRKSETGDRNRPDKEECVEPCKTDHEKKGALSLWKSAFLRTLPYGGVFIFYMIIRLKVIGTPGINPSGWYFKNVTTGARLAAMCIGFLVYLRLLILPVSMSIDYNFPVRVIGPIWAEQPKVFLDFWAFAGLFFIMIYLYLVYRGVRKKSPIVYPLLFFVIAFFPFSNIMPFGDFIAERFLYLPSFGYCLLAGMLFTLFRERGKGNKILTILLMFFLVFYSVRTIIRNRDWRSGIRLWLAEQRQNPKNPIRYSGLGAEYAVERKENLIRGNVFREKGDFKKSAYHLELAREYENAAIEYYEKAIKENPRDFRVYYNYSGLSAEMMKPDIDRAEEILLKGASCMPENLRSLHVFYYYLGLINFKREPPELERALMFFQKAHQLKKSDNTILYFMAATFGRMGRLEESLAIVKKVLARDPGNRQAVGVLKNLRKDFGKKQ